MRQFLAKRILSGTALLVVASLGAGLITTPAFATQTVTKPVADSFDVDDVDTFSGAYLAARAANIDRDFNSAVSLYEKALRFQPRDLELRESLMLALFMGGNFDEGVKYAEELRHDKAIDRITIIARGLDAIRHHRYRSAERILAYKGPNDLDRLTYALISAWAKMGAGHGREALTDIDRLKGPGWFAIFKNYNAGVMAAVLGDKSRAQSYLSNVITDREGSATAPDTFIRAVIALATVSAEAGDKQKALDTLAAGDQAINNYAPFKAMRERIEKGDLPKLVVQNAQDGAASVLFSIGGALNRPGAQDTVALYLQLSRGLQPNAADTLIMLGNIAEANKQTEEAIDYYKAVPSDSPMLRASELQLGLALAEDGKTEEAKAHLKALVASDPQDIRSYLAYGSVLSDAKEYKLMAENYDKAVEVLGPAPDKSQWPVFFQRGIAYERLKEWDKAEPNFRKALEMNPNQPQVLNYLGYSWVDMNRNLKEGLEMIQKAVELKPDDGYIVDSLGWAYYRMGDYAKAVDELERAVQLKAGDATINDHLGDAYWRVGRKLEATYQWNQALAFKPEPDLEAQLKEKLEKGLPDLPDGTGTAQATPPETAKPASQPAPATPEAAKPAAGDKSKPDTPPAADPGKQDGAPEPAKPDAKPAPEKPAMAPAQTPAKPNVPPSDPGKSNP
ncbi:tetratricopeptide repeat protein [Allorhizobium sp. BGMRC 0089]|nr:tetratricopeptide repeat protein [Allorhizobium sonneratiae]MCM2291295.1 tetratricopeptide repeat protein [Allorhizobium sonneratiae]